MQKKSEAALSEEGQAEDEGSNKELNFPITVSLRPGSKQTR